ncbi:MAG TPA: Hsp33 family molecular chaperone HslO [Rhizomicrobium sp.]|nr:Hsp33 family molecular chaperone HslO [Rhizomicrobium sp.]
MVHALSESDFVLPFDLPDAGLRGRLIRLDATSTRALSAHALPEQAARAVCEMLALAAMLGTALKLDGRLIVQSKGDGPLDLVTVDYLGAEDGRPAGLRGYARVDAERFKALADARPDFDTLVGDGVLAITIEPRRGEQSYQGIVGLSGDVASSAENYFAQSEQLPTAIRLAAAPVFTPGNAKPAWRAGGIMLQATPERARDDDEWERLSLFLKTIEDVELVDETLAPETLLWRLFHEDEVLVQRAEPLAFRCDCDTTRIASVLKSYNEEERAGLADPDGIIRARCEFCGKVHEIIADELSPSDSQTD